MPKFTDTRECGFETLIVKWLVEHNGYEEGNNADYNKDYAIDETRLFRFLKESQYEQMEKLGVFHSEQKKRQFLNRLQGEIAKRGIIDVLRNGINVYPASLIMFYLAPSENNEKAKKDFEKKRPQNKKVSIVLRFVKVLMKYSEFFHLIIQRFI